MSGIIVAEYDKWDVDIKVNRCPERPNFVSIMERAVNGDWDPEEVEVHVDDIPKLIEALQYYHGVIDRDRRPEPPTDTPAT